MISNQITIQTVDFKSRFQIVWFQILSNTVYRQLLSCCFI